MTTPLTTEQERALGALLAHLPPKPSAPTPTPATPDGWQAWLGISGHDLRAKALSFLRQKDTLHHQALDWLERNPLEATLEFIVGAAWAFYQAEKGHNEKILTYLDAFYYIATCASVGYADIFAVTQAGRTIAALVMLVGPALAAKSLDRPQNR